MQRASPVIPAADQLLNQLFSGAHGCHGEAGGLNQELDAVGVAENYLPVCIRKGWVMSSRNR